MTSNKILIFHQRNQINIKVIQRNIIWPWWWWMMENCFCGMVDRRKVLSFICSRDHCQRFSLSQIFDTPWAELKPVKNLSLGFVEWSCAVVITTKFLFLFYQIKMMLWKIGQISISNCKCEKFLLFETHFESLYKKGSQISNALFQVTWSLWFRQIKLFWMLQQFQFSYVSIVRMFHRRKLKQSIHNIHENVLRLLVKDNSFRIIRTYSRK